METIKIAIQKSGRLNEKSVEILRKCGLDFENYKSSFISSCKNFKLELLFLRDDDIPEYVQDGTVHLGICGENIVIEKQKEVNTLLKLGFGKCAIWIAIPNDSQISKLYDLNNRRIATSYPNILSKFLKDNDIDANIVFISGSVEISPNLEISHAICDIVSTGGTLKSNGLKTFHKVLDSEAVLIGSPGIENNATVQDLLLRLNSVIKAKEQIYVALNVEKKNLDKIVEMLPGVTSPTIIDLANKEWVSVHSVIEEDKFWEIVPELRKLGAQGILVFNIEKFIV